MFKVQVGEYTVEQTAHGFDVLRHGRPWRNATGDNLILSLAMALDEERQKNALLLPACEKALKQLYHCDCANGVTSDFGDIDEGRVWAGQTRDQLREAIARAKQPH
jgi:hypothetical protein